uniref:Putative secreted protein n=1 Tax=Ixodes ricinus TaxID=34613 RepID=A0A6B0UV58_IXORI
MLDKKTKQKNLYQLIFFQLDLVLLPLPFAILICPTAKVAHMCGFDKRRCLKNKLLEVDAGNHVFIPSYSMLPRGRARWSGKGCNMEDSTAPLPNFMQYLWSIALAIRKTQSLLPLKTQIVWPKLETNSEAFGVTRKYNYVSS